MKLKKSFKNLSLYKKSILTFLVILIILSLIVLGYVKNTLTLYQNCDVDYFIKNFTNNLKKSSQDNTIDKYLPLPKFKSNYENNSNLKNGYQKLLKNAKMTTKKIAENQYDIYADAKKIATISLDDSKKYHRLGLLSFTDYKIKDINAYNQNGLYNIEIFVLDKYKVYVNSILIKKEDLIDVKEIVQYSEVKDLTTIPIIKHYKINNLTLKPTIEIKDQDGNLLSFKEENDTYYANSFFVTDIYDEAFAKLNNKNFNPLSFAKNWSLFLTKDLSGARYGLYKLTPNLLENTEMYNKAVAWATNVDITFTSQHKLCNPIFTNVKVSNYTIYNENLFSVKIYLEKNMILKGGQKRIDKMHEEFYYAYIDGAYRLIKMQAVA